VVPFPEALYVCHHPLGVCCVALFLAIEVSSFVPPPPQKKKNKFKKKVSIGKKIDFINSKLWQIKSH
jgi:hypothetical protein